MPSSPPLARQQQQQQPFRVGNSFHGAAAAVRSTEHQLEPRRETTGCLLLLL